MSDQTVRGVCPIIATPFTATGDIDYDSLRREVAALADRGCHAAALFGVASEFPKLSDRERDEMVDVVTDVAGDHELPLVVSVTHEATAVARRWAQRYETAGADCVMVYPPTFQNPTQAGVVDHVRQVGEAVSVPVMVQHTSQHVGVPPEEFAALHDEVPNVRYFKIETESPGEYITSLLEETGGDVDVLVGAAGMRMIEAYERGCVGVMPAAAIHDVYLKIHDAYRRGDLETAVDVHADVLAFQQEVSKTGIPAEKYILARRGLVDTAHCRAPAPGGPDPAEDDLLDRYFERLRPHLDPVEVGGAGPD